MKKLSLLFLFIVFNSFVFGQSLSKVKLQGMEEQVIKYTVCLENKKVYCFLTPEKENLKSNTYSIRVYNSDFTSYKPIPNLKEINYPVNVQGFHNAICFPTIEKKSSPATGQNSRVIITDTSLKTIKTFSYPIPDNKYEFFGAAACTPNFDSSYLIIANVINPTPGKPSPKTNVYEYQVNIFDKNFNEVFSAYLDFDKIFGKGKEKEINQFKFEYINNSLYIMASTADVVALNVSLPQRFFIAKIDKDGTSKIIHQEVFTAGGFYFDYKVINKEKIIACGIVGAKVKKFYQFTYNTKEISGSVKVNTYLFQNDDKEQKKKFSEFNLYMTKHLAMHVASDGYFVIVDVKNLSSDEGRLKNLYVLFVDFDGELKWFECIPREFMYVDSPTIENDYVSSAFIKDNELYLIYHNIDANILSNPESFSSITITRGNLCLALSVINSDKSISSEVLHNYKNEKTFWLPYTLFKSNNKYYLLGSPVHYIAIHTNSYLGKISLK